MKKFGLLMIIGMTSLVWGSGDVTIQVINAVKESSITREFDKKLEKSGLEIHKVVEGGRYIVTLGTYKDEKSALEALKKTRTVVCKEAFVRPVKRDQVASAPQEAKKTAVTASQEAKKTGEAAHVAVASHAAVSTATPSETKATDVAAPKNEHVVNVEVKPIVVEVKKEPVVLAMSAFEKKGLYKSEIAEAINYYKNSPYHRFEPVMLQR